VLIIEFVGDALGAGLFGDEFDFANEVATPCLVDPGAEVFVHLLELLLPGFRVSGDFEAPLFAAKWTSVSGEGLAYDLRPRTREPREHGFGVIEFAHDASEEIAGLVHDFSRAESATARDSSTRRVLRVEDDGMPRNGAPGET
jgi:hypothetical protein